jgi:hypothetical protein
VYSGLVAFATLLFFILVSNGTGLMNNTSYGRISEDLAESAGYGLDQYPYGHVINGDASSFIYLTSGVGQTLSWLLLLALLALIVLGVQMHSLRATVVPGIVYIIASVMVGIKFLYGTTSSLVLSNFEWLIVSATVLAAVAIQVREREIFGFKPPKALRKVESER